MEEQAKNLHIVMFPWLAIGHLKPFFELAKYLARKGHKITFISTPINLQKTAKVPRNLSHLIDPVAVPLPPVDHLPPDAESSMDVPHAKRQLLKVAFDMLEPKLRSFLENVRPKPDWIIYDFTPHWLPRIAEELAIKRAYFSIFTAAVMAFLGPPSALLSEEHARVTAEDFTVVPEWLPASSGMAFRHYEMARYLEKDPNEDGYDSGTMDWTRFALTIDGSNIVIFKSCVEFEPEWLETVRRLYGKPVFPVGVLPSGDEECRDDDTEWSRIREFLDRQKEGSLVYVAFGSEVVLTHKETQDFALGLEQCGSPFFWVLSKGYEKLPVGFGDRVRDRGIVYSKWAPQVKILGHDAVGGFLTHCGWSSAAEALGFGLVLILFPVMNDQGINCRLLQAKKVGIEIPRNEVDGAFTSDAVAETVRTALVGEEGRSVRANARKMKEFFGSESRSISYVDTLLHHMIQTNGI
ncbi:UDP-glycosyltransferase 91C1-like [Salvia hispanica]|uniref:UDP-glycosyltransferase 91C1-like n=1 Tax=Salvia hispanica TaxID=49212 RepID=UPI00200978E8|nr:UDP-glycosyltransferase 91C1-like [Salvia hispanica]